MTGMDADAMPPSTDPNTVAPPAGATPDTLLPRLDRPVVLVGLMGAGKSCIGKRLASRIGVPFADADAEVERAAGCSIADIFDLYGEAAFRDCERRIMRRLLDERVLVLATGGGAFVDPDTRALIRDKAVSLWLRADLNTLVRRCSRRDNRPLLRQGDPAEILGRLMERRYPVYAEADLVVDSRDVPADRTVDSVLDALAAHPAQVAS